MAKPGLQLWGQLAMPPWRALLHRKGGGFMAYATLSKGTETGSWDSNG